MESQFKLYVLDTETTGLDSTTHEIIELSIYRINDNRQQTWFIRPQFPERSSPDALRINGHKLDDLKCLNKETKAKYQEPNQVIIEVENFFMEDEAAADTRIL